MDKQNTQSKPDNLRLNRNQWKPKGSWRGDHSSCLPGAHTKRPAVAANTPAGVCVPGLGMLVPAAAAPSTRNFMNILDLALNLLRPSVKLCLLHST